LYTLLLKAAQTKDNLAEESLRLARQKQRKIALLQQRTTQLAAGKQKTPAMQKKSQNSHNVFRSNTLYSHLSPVASC